MGWVGVIAIVLRWWLQGPGPCRMHTGSRPQLARAKHQTRPQGARAGVASRGCDKKTPFVAGGREKPRGPPANKAVARRAPARRQMRLSRPSVCESPGVGQGEGGCG
ncbi:MAG: hypothetical protein J3K34DRAFT_435728 [Monoraphidium minutum]|nr:MAG: hypothetical protein J3K34DRAFT_435728 [Monoraphidium minutum]